MGTSIGAGTEMKNWNMKKGGKKTSPRALGGHRLLKVKNGGGQATHTGGDRKKMSHTAHEVYRKPLQLQQAPVEKRPSQNCGQRTGKLT